jgi:hypothetical protein
MVDHTTKNGKANISKKIFSEKYIESNRSIRNKYGSGMTLKATHIENVIT